MDPRRATALSLLEYHAWAANRIFDSVEPLSSEELHRDMKTSHSSVFGTLEHVHRADAIWLKRLQGFGNARLDEVSAADLPGLRKQSAEVHAELIAFAGALPESDWSRVIEYRFMSGAEGRSPIYQNLLHVANHGTYHRGQIVTMLRQMGAEPIGTDFITYVRRLAEELGGAVASPS